MACRNRCRCAGKATRFARHDIVRRKPREQDFAERTGCKRGMSRRVVVVLAILLAVVCGAAAFVWLHAGGQSKTKVNFTPEPPAPVPNGSAPPAEAGTVRTQPAAANSPSTKQPNSAPGEPAGFAPP